MTFTTWPWSSQTITEQQYREVMRTCVPNRIHRGMTFTTSTSAAQFTISPGVMTIEGRVVQVTAAHTVTVSGTWTAGQSAILWARATGSAVTFTTSIAAAGSERSTFISGSPTGTVAVMLAYGTLSGTGFASTSPTDVAPRGGVITRTYEDYGDTGGKSVSASAAPTGWWPIPMYVAPGARCLITASVMAWCENATGGGDDALRIDIVDQNTLRSDAGDTSNVLARRRLHTIGHAPCMVAGTLTYPWMNTTSSSAAMPHVELSPEAGNVGAVLVQSIDITWTEL